VPRARTTAAGQVPGGRRRVGRPVAQSASRPWQTVPSQPSSVQWHTWQGWVSQVFVVVAGKADKRTVGLGVEAPDAVQVTKGLAAGEVVVLDPPTSLGAGAPVEIQNGKTGNGS